MSYTTGIPLASQSLNQTRQAINDNWTAIQNAISENHIAMNVAGAGKHKYVVMPRVASGTPTTLATEGTLFTRIGNSEQTNLYFTSDAGGIRLQLTRAIDAFNATFGISGVGWTFAPGGMLNLYGYVSVSSSTSRSINFAGLGLPDMSDNLYNIHITAWRTTASSPGTNFGIYVQGNSVATTGFNIINETGHDYGFYWSVLGT